LYIEEPFAPREASCIQRSMIWLRGEDCMDDLSIPEGKPHSESALAYAL
jgi:hypothetical protein